MKTFAKKQSIILTAIAAILPALSVHAGTESFVNGGNNDFIGNYAGTQDNTFLENNTTTQDNTNGGSHPYLDAKSSSSARYRFILDFDLSSMNGYASQITISGVSLQLTQYNTFAFESDGYNLQVGQFSPYNYGWSQTTSTGDYYDSTTTPPTDWKNFTGGNVNPPLSSTPASNPANAYEELFTQSQTDPNDFVDGNPIGTQYQITDPTGNFLTAVQNWINNPTQNAGLYFLDNENTGDVTNNVLQYYSDIASNPQTYRPTLILTVSSPTMSTDWTSSSSDVWSNNSDWDNGSPDTIGSSVTFGDVGSSSPITVTLDAAKVVSNLTFNSPGGYIIAGSNQLSIIEVNNNLSTMNVTAGANEISAPLFWGTNTNVNISSGASMKIDGPISGGALINYTGPGALTLGSGTSGGLTATNGSVTVTGAMAMNGPLTINGNSNVTLNGATTVTQIAGDGSGSLTITNGSLVPSAQPVGTITLASLSLTNSKLDISDSNLTINYSGTSPLAAIQSDLAAGYASGAETGNGLVSSYVAAHAGTGLGYEDNGSQVEVMITWLGDLDLDGSVTSADAAAMGVIPTSGPEAGLIGWFDGDLNNDGKINADDYALFALGAALSNGAVITVPEPASLTLIAAAGLALRRRRRA
ncbi:MAG TPA: dockerin type I repeat-containing protein [Tepidisphaeraceae bacterium]|jgi:hypothetical protein